MEWERPVPDQTFFSTSVFLLHFSLCGEGKEMLVEKEMIGRLPANKGINVRERKEKITTAEFLSHCRRLAVVLFLFLFNVDICLAGRPRDFYRINPQ